jgi:hypothetical protein
VELIRELFVVDPGDPVHVRRTLAHERLELAAADEAEAQLGSRAGSGQHGLDTVERDELADEQDRERLGGRPAGLEDALLGADEGDLDPLAREPCELGQMVGARLRVRHDEIGRPKCAAVDRREHPCPSRAGTEATAVGDERVGERDEWVEDHRSPPRRASGREQVEVPGVADEDRIEVGRGPAQQLELGETEPRRGFGSRAPVVAASLPDRDVPLADLDPRPA